MQVRMAATVGGKLCRCWEPTFPGKSDRFPKCLLKARIGTAGHLLMEPIQQEEGEVSSLCTITAYSS